MAGALVLAALIGGLTVRERLSEDEADHTPAAYPPGSSAPARTTPGGTATTNGLLLVQDGRVARLPTSLHGMELVQEISGLLRTENVTMTRLDTQLTLWHGAGAGAGTPNQAASRLMAEHGFPPVTGAAVGAGAMIGHIPFPLGGDEVEAVALGLER
ncbi:hypothetical protein ABZO31_29860 [Streptomyces sp. HUAS MG47]|uniref:hypothetical protein n=1 Tax=Streptomyces solicamelliae TaxID=3231716 RepID=UPI003877B4C4